VKLVGDFDERLGLGARYASSEDVDYILRAMREGVPGLYRPSEGFVAHPYRGHHEKAYYVGVVAVLAKHSFGGGTLPLLLRRFVLGAWLTVSGSLPPGEYIRGMRAAGHWIRHTADPVGR
jgi:hypothetical protein